MSLQETLQNISKDAQTAQSQIGMLDAAFSATTETIKISGEAMKQASGMFNRGFAEMAEGAMGFADPLEALSRGIKILEEDMNTLLETSRLLSLGMGGIFTDSAKEVLDGFTGALSTVTQGVKEFDDASKESDQFSKAIRDLEMQFGMLGVGMGMSFEKTKAFTQEFAKVMSFTRPDFFIAPQEIQETTALLASQGVAFNDLTKQIDTTAGAMSRQEAAIMVARISGESLNTTTKTIGGSMMNLGMSFESAISQYGMIRKAAKETGLQFEDVKSSLEGAVRSFEKLGVGMTFAQPIFSSFVSSLEKVGLGIKQATGLTQTFVSSMLQMTESTEKAFLLQSMGGKDFGAGGGIFGAEIGLQSQLLESADDPAAQANLAMDMADSLKTSLEQFTGGQIVTLQEAAASPDLQATYKVQQELLGQFGISGGKDQARVLELLQGLQSGNVTQEEVSNQLGDLIAQEKDLSTQTLDETEKTARNTAALLAQATIGNSLAIEQARLTRAMATSQGVAARSVIAEGAQKLKTLSDSEGAAALEDALRSTRELVENAGEATSNTIAQASDQRTESTSETERRTDGAMVDETKPVPVKLEIRFTDKGKDYFEVVESISNTSSARGSGT